MVESLLEKLDQALRSSPSSEVVVCGGVAANTLLRKRAAEFADLEPSALEHALLIEYKSGAGIGWHRDRPHSGRLILWTQLTPDN